MFCGTIDYKKNLEYSVYSIYSVSTRLYHSKIRIAGNQAKISQRAYIKTYQTDPVRMRMRDFIRLSLWVLFE